MTQLASSNSNNSSLVVAENATGELNCTKPVLLTSTATKWKHNSENEQTVKLAT